jgi:hypothetical protein
MSEYRNRTTGEVKTQGQWRAANPNMSLPRVWNSNVCDALDLDPVLASPKPSAGQYETVRRNGVTQDANGNWVEAYEVVSMFNEYTDDDGVTHTVAEQEAAYQARLDEQAANSNRTKRNTLLADTDWMALTDVTMSAEMTAYRQALRDITSRANWPNLEEADWPTKPE